MLNNAPTYVYILISRTYKCYVSKWDSVAMINDLKIGRLSWITEIPYETGSLCRCDLSRRLKQCEGPSTKECK